MMRALFISTMLATPALSQAPADLDRLWSSFMRVCPLMLTNPNAYLQALPIPGPNGEPVVSQTVDGKVTEFDTTIEGDIHHGLIVVVGTHQEIGCGMTSNPLAVLNTPVTAEAGEAFFRQKIRAFEGVDISGGLVSKNVSIGFGPVEADRYYQYYITGLVPDVDTVAQVIFGQGFHALHMHRYMIGEAPQ